MARVNLESTDIVKDSRASINQNFIELYSTLDGWILSPAIWSAVDGNTISVTTDITGQIQKGDKVKVYNNSTWKYFYISTAPVFSSATTFDVVGEVILTAGQITTPYYSKIDNPQGFKKGETFYKFSAYLNTNQSINDNTATKILFNTEIYDSNSNFDISNNRYTIPITGLYSISLSAVINYGIAKLALAKLHLYLNGSEVAYAVSLPNTDYTMSMVTLNLNFPLYLTRGAYLEGFVTGDTSDSGAFDVLNNHQTKFSVNFISV